MALFKLFVLFALIATVFADEDPFQDDEKTMEMRTGPDHPQMTAMLAALEARVARIESRHQHILRGKDGNIAGAPGERVTKRPKGDPGRDEARGPHGPNGGGVVYVRWGKTTCPAGASLVYKGRVGGEHYRHTGGGVNYLCLTEQPKYLNYLNGWQHSSRLYGAEYQVSTYANGRTLFGKTLQDHDVPCAVCHVTTRTSKLMIPGTYVCPAGWKREYFGYLMTEYYGHYHPKDYICVDKNAQSVPGTYPNRDGALLYPVESTCGSLPCHPYINAREVTCAVCTK